MNIKDYGFISNTQTETSDLIPARITVCHKNKFDFVCDGRGRHTTTRRQLIKLSNGVMIIDTPGMRELGLWDAAEGLEYSFADIEQYFGKCKFSDCRHESEPECAVKMAIENGELSQERWNNYLQLKKESSFSEGKDGYLMQKWQRNKQIAKNARNLKKMGGAKR